MAKEQILITISGPDHPGITSNLMSIIVKSNYKLLDMGQSVTHGLLSLSILIGLGSNGDHKKDQGPVLKDLLFEAKKMGLDLDFKILNDEKAPDMNLPQGDKFILSCVSPGVITSSFVADISKTLADNNINIQRIDNVSGEDFKSLEVTTIAPVNVDAKNLKAGLMDVSNAHAIDVAFLKENIYRRNKRLIVFDMDSTLIQAEVIVELAKVHGVGDEVHEITERAMNGELDFNQSLIERVSKLKGLEVSKMQEILRNLPLTPGAEEFIKTVKSLGYKVAVISGGFNYFAQGLKEKLGLDYAFANELAVKDGKLTGKVEGTIINAQQKALLVDLISQQENITMEQVVAVGDGANDLPMLAKAGLGIAFHAKDIVKREAQNHMSHGPMTTILYFLGIPGPSY